ncbi:hypothetical protein O3P69_009195 [Scylla paramamosain]|uniref:Condensation domain-containing protein n=1 Tax=Scylla paramamosain TaxID=85552 RepID=A0AAW0TAG3_SCYPA
MAVDSSVVWLRPATEIEKYNYRDFNVTVIEMTLRSSVPLSDSQIREALHHVFRKVPSLRTCFRKHGCTLWACDMNRDYLDFQVTETEDLVPAMEALLQHRFPTTEGPLWCARLLPAGVPARCSRPYLAAAFPYCRTLLLANHHAIADGVTNVFVTDKFLRVLDDVVAGKSITDSAQLGKLVAGEETKVVLTKAIESHFESQIVLRDLDITTTQNFISKCKEENVTVNSGLTAVLNVSLVDFLRQEGLEQEFYHIHEVHAVNLRRYWSGDTMGTLGVHVMDIDNVVSTPANWRGNFWAYARNINKNIGQGLQVKEVMKHLVFKVGSSAADHSSERSLLKSDHGVSNLGNIDHLIPTEGQYVRITHIIGTSALWVDHMLHMFNTLRGCLMYSLTYASNVFSRENAHKLVDITFDNLMTVMAISSSKM